MPCAICGPRRCGHGRVATVRVNAEGSSDTAPPDIAVIAGTTYGSYSKDEGFRGTGYKIDADGSNHYKAKIAPRREVVKRVILGH